MDNKSTYVQDVSSKEEPCQGRTKAPNSTESYDICLCWLYHPRYYQLVNIMIVFIVRGPRWVNTILTRKIVTSWRFNNSDLCDTFILQSS